MFSLQSSWAQQEYYYKQISLNEGLTQSTVSCVLTDHRGMIWIGTKYGLNKFNRYELTSYLHSKGKKNSLPGNQINFIIEDRKKNIWISTEKGLVKYNPDNDDFVTVRYQGKPVVVGSATENKAGLWFGGSGQIFMLNRNLAEIPTLKLVAKIDDLDLFTGMKQWKKDIILLRTRRNGVWMYDTSRAKLTRASFIKDREIMSMQVDSHQQLWISPYGNGIKGFSQNGIQVAHYNPSNSKLVSGVVLDIVEKDGKLWLGTDGGGISILDKTNKTFINLAHIPGNNSSLPENSILTLYKDVENNIWAGSIRGGLIAIKPVFFHTYRDAPLNSVYGLSEKTVLSLHEDDTNNIWIGTDGGGINRFDPRRRTFKHFPSTYGLKVASITEYDQDQLLISAFSKGVFIFNRRSGTLSSFKPEFTAIKQSKGLAINLNNTIDKELYLYTDEIFRYNFSSKAISAVLSSKKPGSEGSLLKIYSDAKRTYFFRPDGIYQLNHKKEKFNSILSIKQRSNPITAAAMDQNGTFWIGTSDGLMYFDVSNGKMVELKTSLFESVSSLVADQNNRLWIGAKNMLFLYLIDQHKFVSFGESDGIVPNEFLSKATLVTKEGDIYLGGVKGLLHVNKNIPSLSAANPKIELMEMELNGLPLLRNVSGRDQKVSIPWNHSSFIVKVMAKEDDVFRKKMFRFEIAGLDVKPIETYDHSFAIGSLAHGKYTVIVSCSLKNGGWSEPVELLQITVNPPWFLSTWFLIFAVMILTSLTLVLYRTARSRRDRKLQWQRQLDEQRSYEAKIKFLINISHELRTPLTLIYSPLRRILKDKQLNSELTTRLNSIYRQANRMKEVIDTVLDVKKIEMGRQDLNLTPVPVNTWVVNIAGNFKQEFEIKGIKLIYELAPEVGEYLLDAQKCEIILNNLMMNALKFSTENSQVTVSTKADATVLRIAVCDEGIGLKGVEIEHLFKPFYQGRHQLGGSGFGLSYAKVLVEMHGGRIAAIQNDIQGATFYFELPQDLGSSLNGRRELAITNDVHFSQNENSFDPNELSEKQTCSLLLVEDEPELLAFLNDNLTESFERVYLARNGREALSILENTSIDIIVSDVMMPEVDGFEFCKILKQDINISHIPVILLTTQGDMESRKVGYKLGADAYLSKPFDLDYLLTRIKTILKNREMLKAKFKNTSTFIEPKSDTYSSADERFMTKLNDLIIANLENPALDVDFLIDKMAMSRASLYGKLKNIGDIGVNDYINKLRLEKSTYLLINTENSIAEITELVGFASQRYFSTVFKQQYKITPSGYRKLNKIN